MIYRFIIICILTQMISLNASSQGFYKMNSYGQLSSGYRKLVVTTNDRVVLFGNYSDTIGTTWRYPIYEYCFLATYPENKFLSLKDSFKYYTFYGNSPSLHSEIMRISDSVFCYFYTKQDTGQEYKKFETWLVWFDLNGDTIRTKKVETGQNIGLNSIRYIPEIKEYFIEACDTVFYGIGRAKSTRLLKLDSLGNTILFTSMANSPYFKYVNMFVTSDTNLLFIGTVYADYPDQFHPYRQYYYFRKYSSKNGALLTYKVSHDSIPDGDAIDIIGVDKLSNGNFLLLAFPKDLELIGTVADYWRYVDDSAQLVLFDNNYNLQRKITFGKNQNNTYHSFTNILPLKKNGALVYGSTRDSLAYVGNEDENGRFGNVVAKFDDQLNEQWRRYYCADTIYRSFYVSNIAEREDGGFYLSGGGSSSGFLSFKSFLIKTDSFGCVISGCQLHDGVQEINPLKEGKFFTLYPNPVKHELNIKIDNRINHKTGNILLMDSKGTIITTFSNMKLEGNIPINVEQLSNGTYYILLKSGGAMVEGEMFIKE